MRSSSKPGKPSRAAPSWCTSPLCRARLRRAEPECGTAQPCPTEASIRENEIQAPTEGIVDEVFVEAGQTVESGAELVHIAAL
ncbi:MAG: hypothetical protein DMF58_10910 [Acidobacteria bacterium]|nr:MAG: hypothetical protein DMF58_10910 [Acidobacteriota bacterium]